MLIHVKCSNCKYWFNISSKPSNYGRCTELSDSGDWVRIDGEVKKIETEEDFLCGLYKEREE